MKIREVFEAYQTVAEDMRLVVRGVCPSCGVVSAWVVPVPPVGQVASLEVPVCECECSLIVLGVGFVLRGLVDEHE